MPDTTSGDTQAMEATPLPLEINLALIGLLAASKNIKKTLSGLILKYGEVVPPSLDKVLHDVQSLLPLFQALYRSLRSTADVKEKPVGRLVLLTVNQVSIPISGCVYAFSALEKEIDGTFRTPEFQGPRLRYRPTWQGNNSLPRWSFVKWKQREEEFQRILADLQGHAQAVELLVAVLSCTSDSRARADSAKLQRVVQGLDRGDFRSVSRDKRPSTGQTASRPSPRAARLRSLTSATELDSAQPFLALSPTIDGRGRIFLPYDEFLDRSLSHRRARELQGPPDFQPGEAQVSSSSTSSSVPAPRRGRESTDWSLYGDATLDQLESLSVLSLSVSLYELHNADVYVQEEIEVGEDLENDVGTVSAARRSSYDEPLGSPGVQYDARRRSNSAFS